jgi:hypothetical protein
LAPLSGRTRKVPVNLKIRSKLRVLPARWNQRKEKGRRVNPAALIRVSQLALLAAATATHAGVHGGERAGHGTAERVDGSDDHGSDAGSNQTILNGSGAGFTIGETLEKMAHVSLLWINPTEGTPVWPFPWALAVGTGHQFTCAQR